MATALFIVLIVLLLSSVPVYVALGLASTVAVFGFTTIPLEIIGQRMFAGIDKFSLMAIPFFILAANIMKCGGLSTRILNLATAVVGHLRGGLALTVIISCMFFGAISGSSPATVIAIGVIMLPTLKKAGYNVQFAIGLIAASAAVAVIIPPSIGMIIYGSITGVSVGDLFMGGVIPGILYGIMFMLYSYYYARKSGIKPEKKRNFKEIIKAFKEAGWALGIPVLVIGGIYGGIFTPTEAAAVTAVYAVVISMVVYKELTFKKLYEEAIESSVGTAQVMILISAASIFAWVLTSQQVPQDLAQMLMSVSDSKIVILLLINIMLLIVGMFIDPASSTTILAPLLFPLTKTFGIDPVHLGIIMVVNGAIGMFTPPFGLNLFVAAGVSKEPIGKIMKGIIPFVIISIIVLLIVTYIPEISLMLIK